MRLTTSPSKKKFVKNLLEEAKDHLQGGGATDDESANLHLIVHVRAISLWFTVKQNQYVIFISGILMSYASIIGCK